MAVQRINIANNKRSTMAKHQKREVAQLLADHKDEKARIKVEHIIREDFTIEGYEVLELLCELVHERVRQISSAKECPEDLREAVSSLIWASKNVDIDELKEISSQLSKKFGHKFTKKAIDNDNNEVNVRLCQKLTYKPPSAKLVISYLQEIAKSYNVAWDAEESGLESSSLSADQPFASPSGSSIPMAPGSGLTGAYSRPPDAPAAPPAAPQYDQEFYEQREREQFIRNQLNGQTVVPIVHAEMIPNSYYQAPPSSATPSYAQPTVFPSAVPTPSPAPAPTNITISPTTAAVAKSNPESTNDTSNNLSATSSSTPFDASEPSIPAPSSSPDNNHTSTNALDSLEARLAALNRRT